jgi:hypothetical protein
MIPHAQSQAHFAGTAQQTVIRFADPCQEVAFSSDVKISEALRRWAEDWIDWRSDNPATTPLRACKCDVEIVAPDPDGVRQLLQGVVIRSGETRKETVELNP